MITNDLRRDVALTDRQRDVLSLAEQYYAVAQEPPSTGWLSRRLSISRKRAWEHMQALRAKGRWIVPRSTL